MADGSVKIDVGLNLAKAEKDLEKLKAKIAKTEDQLNTNASRKTALEEQIRTVGAQADEATKRVQELKEALGQTSNRNEKATIRAQLAEATEEQRILTRESNRLNDEYVKVSQKIEQGTTDLTAMKDQAGELVREINAARPGEALAKGLDQARKSLMKFLKYAIGIRSVYFLFRRIRSAIKDAVKSFAEYDEETKRNLKTMEATKNALKTAFGAGLAGIYTALLPVIQKIANWMLDAANAASRFIAILSGKDTYKKAVISTAEIESSMEDTEEATKETKRQLMGFDELNVLNGDNSLLGQTKADKKALDGIEMIEEAVDAFDGSFLSNLALTVKDVLFDWDDLNPEQIAEKIIAGLGAVLGATLGITLGLGPGGVILMTLAGLALGLVLDSLIFDHDGVLSSQEIADMISLAITALAGGVIGFLAGGPGGALIGATVSLGLWAALKALDICALGENSNLTDQLAAVMTIFAGAAIGFVVGGPGGALIGATIGIGIFAGIKALELIAFGGQSNIVDQLVTALTILTGAAIGFVVGGPAGALIGATIGLGVSAIVESLKFSKLDDKERSKYKSGLDWFIVGVLGLPTDEQIKKWGRDAINWLGDGLIDFTGVLHELIGGPIEKLIEEDIPETIKWFQDMGPTISKWISEGFWDFTGLLHDLIGGPLENLIEVEIPETIKWFEEIGPNAIEFFKTGWGKFETYWNDNIAQYFTWSYWQGLIDDIFGGIHFPHITLPHIRIDWEPAEGWAADILSALGMPISFPNFSIDWYAKGGVFDYPRLIGVGENGKEAVVPLEKNTEWMRMVADGLMDRLTQANFANELASAFMSTPLPATAGGTVVPPNAYQAGYGGSESSASIMEELRELRKAIMSQPIQCKGEVYLDKRKVGESVTEYQRTNERARG